MRFEGLNVSEFFSNIKDKLSKVTKGVGDNSDLESPNAANSTGLNSSQSPPELSGRITGERSEYVISEDAEPPEESELASEYSYSEQDEFPIVKRDWEGLRRLIVWLEIEPQVSSLQEKGKRLLGPGLSLLGNKLPEQSHSSELPENSAPPNTELQINTELQENSAPPNTELQINTELQESIAPPNTKLQINTEVQENSAPLNTELQINTELQESIVPPEDSAPQKNTKKRLSRRPKFWIGLGVLSIGSGALIYGLWILYTLDKGLPDVNDLSAFNRDGTLTIKAADNTILLQSGPATRDKLKLKEIPELLTKAFIAIEDRRFYEHRGVDYQGIVRSIASNVIARDLVQGGSTITQQLARVVFLNQERSLKRKVREALLAQKIERELTKEQVLERYLNLVYLGSDAYGVADAAWVFFSKPVDKLTLAEMATLAGLPPAPSEYSPLVNPNIAKQRRNIVLQQMQEAKVITEAQAKEAQAEPIKVKQSQPKRFKVVAPYFASYIRKELPRYVSKDALESGGLTVETTVDLKWQKIAEQVIKDAIDVDGRRQGFEQAALVSIEAKTGEVKALVGGGSFKDSQFNRATQALRQPGSTFKGLVYAAAMGAGFSPYDSYEDAPIIIDGYQPNNYGKKFSGWRSISDALTSSVNVVAVRVLMDVGFEPAIKLAHDMGIKSKLSPIYSLALGSSEVNLLELTNAYGTLASEGNFIEAHGITKVIDQRGDVIYKADFKPKRVLDKDSAAITTWMLEGVVTGGTGGPASLGDRAVAGKTGTSEKVRDLWFIGYIPQVVTGVWLGNDDNYPTGGTSGTAAYNWRDFMSKAVKGMPVQEFPKLPKLEGRKGSIKAKPVEPKEIIRGMIMNDDGAIVPYNPNPEPKHREPAYQEPAYQEPAYKEPAYQEPAYQEPERYQEPRY
ncbi:MAG: penicillin-binding protein 1A [Microcoleus sp. PH2017_29_MFU_D_A]|uniref:transglycosylase domain-containing protein n=1 Tax=unclassified Microcoleus TaxID=2642155 RepID=UPI001D37F671|nr:MULTISPECIES: penicillin-binding protein 1A [unclassified Microcoleus]TAE62776.1 MAG: penicillin-binding protein 1A [Oscillatoriales cyanobacterium]MCC3453842.1 penicillin-binding protein 1A [Microcoleus sp. PH2017_08_TRC_O_A]MCC3571831.1 penicillin-binding protein 1A [Microcoleus sp. PH2017_34_RAT_O_A]MCC3603692.1 penicillin-binding protein 1A [Microcoleus sp. PH2017_29_MFU_D_A]MCC3609458.1 penicillin-binding protein 1A [Microcoleus sp. PH2017_40_RAT_O_B]